MRILNIVEKIVEPIAMIVYDICEVLGAAYDHEKDQERDDRARVGEVENFAEHRVV